MMTDRVGGKPNGMLSRLQRKGYIIPSYPSVVAVVYLLLLALAEGLVANGAPLPGQGLHALILLALFLQAYLVNQPTQRIFLLSLTLAPLIRLLSLSMPLALFPIVYSYMVVGAPLFIAIYLITRLDNIKRDMVGLVFTISPLQLIVSLSGLILGYSEYLILRPSPLAPAFQWELIILPALILLIFTGLLEELIFRGLMQFTALQYLGRYSILYVSAVFAVLHLGYRSVLDFLFVFGVALFFGFIVKRSGSILGVTLAHGLTNISLYLIFPFIFMGGGAPGGPLPSSTLAPGATATAKLPASTTQAAPAFATMFSPTLTPVPGATLTAVLPAKIPQASPVFPTRLSPTLTPVQTQKPVIFASKTPAATITRVWLTPTLLSASSDCSKSLKTRLSIGQKAKVVSDLYLRIEPGTDHYILFMSRPGDSLEIIGGPVCIPDSGGEHRWWQVQLSNGMQGWSMEASAKDHTYFLSPLPLVQFRKVWIAR